MADAPAEEKNPLEKIDENPKYVKFLYVTRRTRAEATDGASDGSDSYWTHLEV